MYTFAIRIWGMFRWFGCKMPFFRFFIFYFSLLFFQNINLWYNNIACSMCYCIVLYLVTSTHVFECSSSVCAMYVHSMLLGCGDASLCLAFQEPPGQRNEWMKEKQQTNEQTNNKCRQHHLVNGHHKSFFALKTSPTISNMHQRDYGASRGVVFFLLFVSSHCQEYQCREIIFLIHIHEYMYINAKWER